MATDFYNQTGDMLSAITSQASLLKLYNVPQTRRVKKVHPKLMLF